MEQAADYLECSVAKISRIETGRLPARMPDVRHMLDLYGVTGTERDELLDLARQSRQKRWWHDYSDAPISDGYETFLGLQDAAATIEEYQPYVFPGLLQTKDYAYTVLSDQAHLTEPQIDRMVELQEAYQKEILERSRPPMIRFLIDEAVLQRRIGTETMMREQLSRIIQLADREHITVQLVPFSAGFTAAYGTPFVLVGFPDPADPKVVYVEHLYGGHFETKGDALDRYLSVAESVRNAALTPSDTLMEFAHRLTCSSDR